jgi:alpha-galactosidase
VQELAVLGHIHRDKELVAQALKLDPLTSAVCTLDEVDRMTVELFEAQARWLPQFSGSAVAAR